MSAEINKIFDFNIHFPTQADGHVNETVDTEMNISTNQLLSLIKNSNYKVDGANIMIFNTSFEDHKEIRKQGDKKFGNSMITQLINPDDYENDINYLDIDAIKFHPYHQNITRKEYGKILHICNKIDKIITIDTSYGSSKMYKNNPMELACLIADEIPDKPIVLLHSGGLKCIEAMLLAQSQDNIFLETSLSYSYYLGSSVAKDIEYIYKQLGPDRILFASDSPYFDLEIQKQQINQLLDNIGFDDKSKHKVFYQNAMDLLCQ